MDQRPVRLSTLPGHAGSSRELAALQREFSLLRELDHPNIERLLDLGRDGDRHYVISELLDGAVSVRETLVHLAPDRLEVSDADDVVRAIGSALCYAHDRDIAHGDVSAANVVITPDRRFVLTNFLAWRLTKGAGRPARTIDDLRGLARLAAKLYAASSPPQAVGDATSEGRVPAARSVAIRAALGATPNRRVESVAEFLAAAGLALPGARTARRRRTAQRRPPQPPQRLWTWHLAVPIAAALGIGIGVTTYFAAEKGGDSPAGLPRRNPTELRIAAPEPGPAGGTATSAPVPAPELPAAPPTSISDAVQPVAEPAVPAQRPARVPPALVGTADAAPSTVVERADDPAMLSLGVTKIAAREDHTLVAIDVVRSGDTTRETAVGWWTTPDTAHEGDDYARVGRQTVTVPAGATVGRLLIPLVNDGVRESDEVFTVHLSPPRNAVAGPVTAARVTLHDDD